MREKNNNSGLFGFLFSVGIITAIGVLNNKRKIAGIGYVASDGKDAQRYVDQQIEDFTAFVNRSLSDGHYNENFVLELLEKQAKKLNRLIDADIKYIEIPACEIRHVYNRHVGKNETDPNNIPMTYFDLYSIPSLLNFGQISTQISTRMIDGIGAEFYYRLSGAYKLAICLRGFFRIEGGNGYDTLMFKTARIEKE